MKKDDVLDQMDYDNLKKFIQKNKAYYDDVDFYEWPWYDPFPRRKR